MSRPKQRESEFDQAKQWVGKTAKELQNRAVLLGVTGLLFISLLTTACDCLGQPSPPPHQVKPTASATYQIKEQIPCPPDVVAAALQKRGEVGDDLNQVRFVCVPVVATPTSMPTQEPLYTPTLPSKPSRIPTSGPAPTVSPTNERPKLTLTRTPTPRASTVSGRSPTTEPRISPIAQRQQPSTPTPFPSHCQELHGQNLDVSQPIFIKSCNLKPGEEVWLTIVRGGNQLIIIAHTDHGANNIPDIVGVYPPNWQRCSPAEGVRLCRPSPFEGSKLHSAISRDYHTVVIQTGDINTFPNKQNPYRVVLRNPTLGNLVLFNIALSTHNTDCGDDQRTVHIDHYPDGRSEPHISCLYPDATSLAQWIRDGGRK